MEGAGFAVVRDYTGHGIGRAMHEDPPVHNTGRPGTGVRLRSGNVLAIEPMVSAGTDETVVLDDGWSVLTADRAWAAHTEHTVAITDAGPESFDPPLERDSAGRNPRRRATTAYAGTGVAWGAAV